MSIEVNGRVKLSTVITIQPWPEVIVARIDFHGGSIKMFQEKSLHSLMKKIKDACFTEWRRNGALEGALEGGEKE